MSNFAFLEAEQPELQAVATKPAELAYPSARTPCFHGACWTRSSPPPSIAPSGEFVSRYLWLDLVRKR